MPSLPSCRTSLFTRSIAAPNGSAGANLRTDVDADAVRLEPAIAGHALVDPERLANVDAELVLAQPGRDVGMRLRKHIRIHAQRKARRRLQLAGARGQQLQLRLALDVELENPRRREPDRSPRPSCPTPEKTTRPAASGAAAITRSNSPPETMSNPAP